MKKEKVFDLRQPDYDDTIRYPNYWGHETGECGIQIWMIHSTPLSQIPKRYVVVMTEIEGNEGLSVTNGCEYIAEEVFKNLLPSADPETIIWIEHYPPRGGRMMPLPESYDKVSLRYNGKTFKLDESQGHSWKRLTEADLQEIGIL